MIDARALELINDLQSLLGEAHQSEIDNDHYGDNPTECSYCRAIYSAQAMLLANRVEPLIHETT